jgi:hypothetical protein
VFWDTDLSQWLIWNGATWGPFDVATWLGLSDTDAAYTGKIGYVPKVNAGATGLELTDIGDLLDTEIQPGCRVYHDQDFATTVNVWTTLPFNSERFDNEDMHHLSVNNSRITIPAGEGGFYTIGANIQWDTDDLDQEAGYYGLRILLNGTQVIGRVLDQAGVWSAGGFHITISLHVVYSLSAGDYIEIQARSNQGDAKTVEYDQHYSPEFWAVRIDWRGTSAAGATTWAELTDTPGSLSGQGGKISNVNVAGTALVLTDAITLANAGLHLLDTGGDHDLIISPGSDLTTDRTLTLVTGDADRTITLTGNTTLNQDVSTTGSPTFADCYVTDGGTYGIAGNELLTFNEAGTAVFSGCDIVAARKDQNTTTRIVVNNDNLGTNAVAHTRFSVYDGAAERGYFGMSGSATAINDVVIGNRVVDDNADVLLTLRDGGFIHAFKGGGKVLFNETINTDMTIGLTIQQDANDDEILAFKSSDVGHPMTDIAEGDTYGTFKKAENAAGGLNILGLRDADSGSYWALNLEGCLGEAADTTKTTSGHGVIAISAWITNGGTSVEAPGADANLLTIEQGNTTRFIFDAEGSAHADVEWVPFDEYDDVKLLEVLEGEFARRGNPIKDQFGDWVGQRRAILQDAGVVKFYDDGPRAMVNFTRLQMLTVGAIRQMAERLKRYEHELIGLGVDPMLLA